MSDPMLTTGSSVPVAKNDKRHGSHLEKFRNTHHRSMTKKVVVTVAALIVAGVAWLGYTAASAVQKITSGSADNQNASPFLKFFGQSVDPNQLMGEGDGRINLLLVGIGGSNHKGGTLADTIMVASIDPEHKKLALLSIPRDLRVSIPGFGVGKINSAHSSGESEKKGSGPTVLKETVSDVLDLPIHYYVRVDFTGFEKFIDAVGGVTIDVPKAISDPFYPDSRTEGYDPFSIKAGIQTLNGKTALKYARSRETTSDFDRAARQQQLLLAVREKLTSLGFLTNPAKISETLTILGEHVVTDLSATDMTRLAQIAKDVDTSQTVTKVLDNSADGPLTSISDGGYYLVPKTGNFKEVQRIAHELFTDPYLVKEQARIEILNGTGSTGVARELELDLEALGYTIVSIDTTDAAPTTTLRDFTGGKVPFTSRFLADRVKATVKNETRPADKTTVDLQLILGQDYLSLPTPQPSP